MALPAPAAKTAGTTFWWPSTARAGACAPCATRGAWPRRRPPERPRLPPLASAPVGAVGAQAPCVNFHPATAVDAHAVGQAQASLRRRILRAFVGRGLLECFEAKEMLGYRHSGFSVDTSVCIAAHDRAGLRLTAQRFLGRCGCLHRSRKPRHPGAPAAVLRPPTLCDGTAAQRGCSPGVPLRQTAQRTHQ